MLQRTDVERIVHNYIKENLRIEIKDSDFTCPNNRTVIVRLGNEEIDRVWFDVVQKSEYEG